jgi:outer membrane receptor for ferrienterochelin and colicins
LKPAKLFTLLLHFICAGFIITLLVATRILAQNIYKAKVRDEDSHSPLAGVNVVIKGTTIGSSTNDDGEVTVHGVPDGTQTLVFGYIGYKDNSITLNFPLPRDEQGRVIYLEQKKMTFQGITVTATRTPSHIDKTPVRVQVLGTEELQEKTYENPFNISELLSELSAVQPIRSSSVSGATGFRLLGLYSRYTQLLKDGFPMYGGLSSDLSFMQIPPVDLQRVEIIKGPSSVLCGNGGMSGLIDLMTRSPGKPGTKLDMMADHTSHYGTSFNLYSSYRKKKTGITITADRDYQLPYDGNNDGFSDIPKVNSYRLSPGFFYYINPHTTLTVHLNTNYENRVGGDMKVIDHKTSYPHIFRQVEKTRNNYYTALFKTGWSGNQQLTIKQSLGNISRKWSVPGQNFSGNQIHSYNEISYNPTLGNHELAIGSDWKINSFREDSTYSHLHRNYTHSTVGFFVQDHWELTHSFTIQPGFRSDYNNRYHWFFLPQLSMIYNLSKSFYTRMSYGLGYLTPDLFSASNIDEYQNQISLPGLGVLPERSKGAIMDVHYAGIIGDDMSLTFDQSFFDNEINHPLNLMFDTQNNRYHYISESSPLKSMGFETNFRLNFDDWQWFAGYTYVKTHRDYQLGSALPLSPDNKLITILSYEKDWNWSIDTGAIYTGHQYLDNGSRTPAFFTMDMLAKKYFGRFTLIFNAENLTNYIQKNVVIPPYTDPNFTQVWAPLVGRSFNVMVKYSI